MRGKRTNWLLIKHRDEYAREGDGDALLAEDRSVASGRTMAAIAAGKGRGPKPFMLAARRPAEPDAVWDSSKAQRGEGAAAQARSERASAASGRRAIEDRKSRRRMPDFIPPQLCDSVERPPDGRGLGARDQVRRLSHAVARRRTARRR